MTASESAREAAISACVDLFYGKAFADAELGPLFRAAIPDLPGHLEIIRDFWSHALLGSTRYKGSPFQAHASLPIELKHFDRWLELFSESAQATLPPAMADRAIAKAKHMTQSFTIGMFPFINADGLPSRTPQ